jgi:predicted nucleic acid-binding protein
VTAQAARRTPALLLDTNVLLDVLLRREPWATEAVLLLDAIHRGAARGLVSAHSITTVHYIVERAAGCGAARTAVSDVLDILEVVSLDASDFQRALSIDLADYEDAVQVAACLKAGADYLVTRDAKDFRSAPVRVHAPGEVLAIIAPRHRPS